MSTRDALKDTDRLNIKQRKKTYRANNNHKKSWSNYIDIGQNRFQEKVYY